MGELKGIAFKPAKRAPMTEVGATGVGEAGGIDGDHRGRPGDRQVTIVAREDWQTVCAALGAELPWTYRRANLLIEGVALPREPGARLRVGECLLEITGETPPCARMDEQHAGLTEALKADWRGGRTCRVVSGGAIRIGDPVRLVDA